MIHRALHVVLATAFVCVAVILTGVAGTSCSSVSNSRIGVNAPPFSEDTFRPLGDYLIYRCGTLDCHGQTGRNFRVYGCDGMRVDADASSSCVPRDPGGGPTTLEEYQSTYRSLVGLEPQVMSTVWAGCAGATSPEGGAAYPPPEACHPELLTFVEKARGTEKHKGGQLICVSPPCPAGVPNPNPYDQQDMCIVSWLEGNVNMAACSAVSAQPFGFAIDASAE